MDENGKLAVKELEIEGAAKFKGLTEFQNLTKFGTPQNPQGITLFDPAGSPYCVRIETGGAVVSTLGECAKP